MSSPWLSTPEQKRTAAADMGALCRSAIWNLRVDERFVFDAARLAARYGAEALAAQESVNRVPALAAMRHRPTQEEE